MLDKAYKEFISLANDLAEAKKERVKTQYYTGTKYMREEYRKKAEEFQEKTVKIFLKKIKELIEK